MMSKNSKSLSDNFITSIYEDNETNFWIGTFRGLDQMNRKTGEFKHYKMVPGDTNHFSHNMVSSILEDHKGQTLGWVVFQQWNTSIRCKKGQVQELSCRSSDSLYLRRC